MASLHTLGIPHLTLPDLGPDPKPKPNPNPKKGGARDGAAREGLEQREEARLEQQPADLGTAGLGVGLG